MKDTLLDLLAAGAVFYAVGLVYHIVASAVGLADLAFIHYVAIGYATVKVTNALRS